MTSEWIIFAAAFFSKPPGRGGREASVWEARRQDISSDKLRNNQGLWEASRDENEKEQMDSGDYPAGFSDHVNMEGGGEVIQFYEVLCCFYLRQL